MEHSIIAASSAGIWGSPNGCTGWVLMSQFYPDTKESQDALDGNASHEIGSTLINAYRVAKQDMTFDNFDGKTAKNGVLFTEEMFDAAKIYADNVATVMQSTRVFGGEHFNNEQRLDCKRIHDIAFGTPDQWIYAQQQQQLYIWDYKFGHGVVEIFENWQILVYLAGILDKLNVDGILDQRLTIHMRIVQPRAFHHEGIVREWVVKASDLRGYFNQLAARASEALGPNSLIRSGPHCRYCSARHACSAALEAGTNLYEVAKQPLPAELPPDALGLQYAIVKRAIKQLEYIETGLKAQVDSLLKNGERVPGWKFEQGFGREDWTKPTSEVIAMGKMFEHDLSQKPKAITPKQARAKGISDDMLAQYSEVKRTGLILTPDDGKKAKRLFKL